MKIPLSIQPSWNSAPAWGIERCRANSLFTDDPKNGIELRFKKILVVYGLVKITKVVIKILLVLPCITLLAVIDLVNLSRKVICFKRESYFCREALRDLVATLSFPLFGLIYAFFDRLPPANRDPSYLPITQGFLQSNIQVNSYKFLHLICSDQLREEEFYKNAQVLLREGVDLTFFSQHQGSLLDKLKKQGDLRLYALVGAAIKQRSNKVSDQLQAFDELKLTKKIIEALEIEKIPDESSYTNLCVRFREWTHWKVWEQISLSELLPALIERGDPRLFEMLSNEIPELLKKTLNPSPPNYRGYYPFIYHCLHSDSSRLSAAEKQAHFERTALLIKIALPYIDFNLPCGQKNKTQFSHLFEERQWLRRDEDFGNILRRQYMEKTMLMAIEQGQADPNSIPVLEQFLYSDFANLDIVKAALEKGLRLKIAADSFNVVWSQILQKGTALLPLFIQQLKKQHSSELFKNEIITLARLSFWSGNGQALRASWNYTEEPPFQFAAFHALRRLLSKPESFERRFPHLREFLGTHDSHEAIYEALVTAIPSAELLNDLSLFAEGYLQYLIDYRLENWRTSIDPLRKSDTNDRLATDAKIPSIRYLWMVKHQFTSYRSFTLWTDSLKEIAHLSYMRNFLQSRPFQYSMETPEELRAWLSQISPVIEEQKARIDTLVKDKFEHLIPNLTSICLEYLDYDFEC